MIAFEFDRGSHSCGYRFFLYHQDSFAEADLYVSYAKRNP